MGKKKGKKRREKARRRKKKDIECVYEEYKEYMLKDKEWIDTYCTHLKEMTGASIYLCRYVVERFMDDAYGQGNKAASVLFKIKECKLIQDLYEKLMYLFPHADSFMIQEAIMNEDFDPLATAERVFSLTAHSMETLHTFMQKEKTKKKKLVEFLIAPSLVKRHEEELLDYDDEEEEEEEEFLPVFRGSTSGALAKAKELRLEAQNCHEMMLLKFQDNKRNCAAMRGIRADEGNKYKRQKQMYQREAGRLTFFAHNSGMYPDEINFDDDVLEPQIDLHGLIVKEAIEYASIVIKTAHTVRHHKRSGCRMKRIRFLTGRGSHSGINGPRVLPALIRYFSKSNHQVQKTLDSLIVKI